MLYKDWGRWAARFSESVSGSVTQLVVVCSELCIAEGTRFRTT